MIRRELRSLENFFAWRGFRRLSLRALKVLGVIGESTKIGNVNNDKIISSDNKNMQPK